MNIEVKSINDLNLNDSDLLGINIQNEMVILSLNYIEDYEFYSIESPVHNSLNSSPWNSCRS